VILLSTQQGPRREAPPVQILKPSTGEPTAPLIVDLAYLRRYFCEDSTGYYSAIRYAAGDKSDPNLRLKVTNGTRLHAEVCLLASHKQNDQKNDEKFFMLAPGDSIDLFTRNGSFWLFRAESGEVLGMAEGAKQPPRTYLPLYQQMQSEWFRVPFDPYTITETFRDAAREYAAKPRYASDSKVHQGIADVKVIGERRSTTPGPDDRMFMSTAVVGWNNTKTPDDPFNPKAPQPETFNGLANRVVKDVEIAGCVLRWNAENQILKEHYGEFVSDVRNLTIFADHMIVDDHLWFPGTNVTIYARRLTISESGSITTTPVKHPHHARSEYLIPNPDDPALPGIPADVDGKPTYRAASGRNGQRAGNITLIVCEIIDRNRRTAIFNASGGKGQNAEQGGLRAASPDSRDLPTFTLGEIASQIRLQTFFAGDARDAKRDPAWDDWIASSTVNLNGKQVPLRDHAKASIVSWEIWFVKVNGDDFSKGVDGYELSRQTSSSPKNVWYSVSSRFEPLKDIGAINWEFANCQAALSGYPGRGPYPGGWPGDGGDGATITSRFGGAQLDPLQCHVLPGQHGDPTPPVDGTAPRGPQPAYHLRLVRFERRWEGVDAVTNLKSLLADKSELRNVSVARRDQAPGFFITGDGRDFSSLRVNCGEREGHSKRGQCINEQKTDDLSWMRPAALSATLDYARLSFRNGFREEAAAAIHPYLKIATSSSRSLASLECQALLQTAVHMHSNLMQNLDYYGNPPGWVPRLNALSNLTALKAILENTYETWYFADKLLRDYEVLEDQRKMSQNMSAALTGESQNAAIQLEAAYRRIPGAVAGLVQTNDRVQGVKTDIDTLENIAKENAISQLEIDKVGRGLLKLAGGVAKAVPIGQPIVGLGGSLLTAASIVDFKGEDPFASGKQAIDNFATSVNMVITDKTDLLVDTLTSDMKKQVSAKQSLVTKLTTQIANDEKLKASSFADTEKTWKDFKKDELAKIAEHLKEINDQISTVGEKKPKQHEIEAAQGLQRQLLAQKAVLDEKRRVPLHQQLAEYRKQQFDLLTEAHRLANAENAVLKEVAQKSRQARGRAPGSTAMLDVNDQLAVAQSALESKQSALDQQKGNATDLMANLGGIGAGLSDIGDAILSMAKPISPDDPAVRRLTGEILVKDSYLNSRGRELASKLSDVMEEKKTKAEAILKCQAVANRALSTLSTNLATQSALSNERQSLNRALNPAVKSYLQQARRRAQDALSEAIYWFVKSYQYEFLKDVQDSFYNFDRWAEQIKQSEEEKARAQPGNGLPATDVARSVILEKSDFMRVGAEVFRLEHQNLGEELLAERQKRAPSQQGDYKDCILDRSSGNQKEIAMLDSLSNGECVFHWIDDFDKGSFDWDNARVIDVKLAAIRVKTNNPRLTLTIRIEQTGDMIIAKSVGTAREHYVFRPAPEDEPIGWQFQYNHEGGQGKIDPSGPDDGLGKALQELISEKLANLKDYKPALFSKYQIRITDLPTPDKGISVKIDRLKLGVRLSQGWSHSSSNAQPPGSGVGAAPSAPATGATRT
jgi:hypothetical protein